MGDVREAGISLLELVELAIDLYNLVAWNEFNYFKYELRRDVGHFPLS